MVARKKNKHEAQDYPFEGLLHDLARANALAENRGVNGEFQPVLAQQYQTLSAIKQYLDYVKIMSKQLHDSTHEITNQITTGTRGPLPSMHAATALPPGSMFPDQSGARGGRRVQKRKQREETAAMSAYGMVPQPPAAAGMGQQHYGGAGAHDMAALSRGDMAGVPHNGMVGGHWGGAAAAPWGSGGGGMMSWMSSGDAKKNKRRGKAAQEDVTMVPYGGGWMLQNPMIHH